MTAIEESVIRWMTSPFDLPESSGGVQVWLALRLHGVSRFRDELDRMLDLAERMAGRLGTLPGVQLIDQPQLSVVAFRAEAGDDATRAILDALLESRQVHVSSTTVDGDMYVRFAFLNQRTTDSIVDQAIQIVETTLHSRR